MAEFNPTALLSKPMDDIKPPVPLPLGSYVATATDYKFDKTKPKEANKEPTNLVKVEFRITEPFPDVDTDQLNEALDGKQLTDLDQRPLDFFLTEGALFRLKEFLVDHCKIGEEAANPAEGLEIMKGENRQFGVEVTAVPNQRNPERPYHQVTRTFPLPE